MKWEQMVFLGNPEYACKLSPINFAAVARARGAEVVSRSMVRPTTGSGPVRKPWRKALESQENCANNSLK